VEVLDMPGAFLIAGPLLACSPAASAPLTTGHLLRQMVDLDVLAELPDPPYKTIQFSSYDRRSIAPYAPGWYANSDGFGKEPTPNFLETLEEPGADGVGRYLMAQVDGPGAIVRCWTAAINGDVAVSLDGSSEPLYQGSAAKFLGQTYSELALKAGTIDEPAPEGFRQQEACYFPIPFAKSLRIEWIGKLNEIHFYQIEVRCYPEGTQVQTFALDDLRTYAGEIEGARKILVGLSGSWEPPAKGTSHIIGDVSVSPGEQKELLRIEKGGAIQRLHLRPRADDLHRALRQVVLKGYFDGASRPQIEAPIGDFFGSGPGVSPYDSLPMTVDAYAQMTCRFVMPFRESAVLVAENLGDQPVNIFGNANTRDYAWEDGRSMHFHAKWRVDHELVADGGDNAFDLPYLSARGRGTLVGVAAMIVNPSAIPTSGGNWWGEGDEKIWFDDDTFPSLFGTGSEDYFNYSWSRPTLFHHAYCAQPLDTGPDNRGFVANNRWHILDALPFEQRIDFFMELFHHTRTPGLSYARIAYFYAEPWVRDDHVPITKADVTQGLDLPENWQPVAAGAANGAIFYQAEDILATEGENIEIASDRLYSAGKLVKWVPEAEGEKLDLKLGVENAGRYQVVATCAMSPSSGRVTVSLDGGEPMEPLADLWTRHHTMLRNFFFNAGETRTVELAPGEHTLTFISQLPAEDRVGMDVGIDFVWLLPR
jgi:hypothetical protein